MRVLDDAVLFVQIDRRYVDFIRAKVDRVAEISRVADRLQLCFRHDADTAVRTRTVDPDNFAMAIGDADDPKRIGRPERHLGGQPALQPFAPERLGGPIDGIDPAIETRAYQSRYRSQATKGRNIAAPGANLGLQLVGDKSRMGLDPVEHPRQHGLFQASIAQPSDRGYRDRHQRNHRDGKPGCQRHRGFARPPMASRSSRRAKPMLERFPAKWKPVRARKRHRAKNPVPFRFHRNGAPGRITGRKRHRRMAGTTGRRGRLLPGSRRPPPAGRRV